MRVLIDTCVIIDALQSRAPFAGKRYLQKSAIMKMQLWWKLQSVPRWIVL